MHRRRRSLLKKHNKNNIIFTGLTIIGFFTTSVLLVDETCKAVKIIEKAEETKGSELTKKEVLTNAFPVYIPAITTGVLTLFCIGCNHVLNNRQQKSLTASYIALSNYHKLYRQKVIERNGAEEDKAIRSEIVRCYNFHELGLNTPDQKCIFIEPITGQQFIAYERELMDAEYHINRNYVLVGDQCLNDILKMFGLEEVPYGYEMGFQPESGIAWIDFSHDLINNGDDGGYPIYEINTAYPLDDFTVL